jgi:hypothetical protein
MPTAGDSVAAGVRAHAVGCSPRYSAFPVPRVTPWATLAHCGTRRWVVERSFAWLTRFRRLARDFERLPETLAGLHYLDFACLLLAKAVKVFASSQQLLGSELRSIDERGGGFARHFGAVAGDLRGAVCSGRTFRHCPPGNGQARIPGAIPVGRLSQRSTEDPCASCSCSHSCSSGGSPLLSPPSNIARIRLRAFICEPSRQQMQEFCRRSRAERRYGEAYAPTAGVRLSMKPGPATSLSDTSAPPHQRRPPRHKGVATRTRMAFV